MGAAFVALPAAAAGAMSLFTVMLWGVALGLALAWRNTIGALFEHIADTMDRASFHVGPVPVRPLAPFAAQLRQVDWFVQQILDRMVHGCEVATVWLFHTAIHMFKWTAHEIAALAEDAGKVMWRITEHTIPNAVRRVMHHTDTRVAREAHSRSTAVARTNAHVARIGHDVNVITHETTIALPRDIGRIRSREGFLERDFEGIRSRVKSVEGKFAAAAFAGLVITALGRIGLKWLRCGNVNRVGRSICGMNPSLLESLLADALAVGGALSLVELAEEMQPIVGESANLIQRFWRAV